MNILLFFLADDADRDLLYLSQSYSFCFPSSKVSATALMHSLTTPPSVNVFFLFNQNPSEGTFVSTLLGRELMGQDPGGLLDCLFSVASVQTCVGMQ